MTYIDRYISLLEEENRKLKRDNQELEDSLLQTKEMLGYALEKWDEAVDKYYRDKMATLWKKEQ